MTIEFKIWRDAQELERNVRDLMDVNKHPEQALQHLVATAERNFNFFTDSVPEDWDRSVSYARYLDLSAACVTAAAEIYRCNRWRVAQSLGRENASSQDEQEKANVLAVMKSVLVFVKRAVHELQNYKTSSPRGRMLITKYAMYLCEQAQRMVGPYDDYSFDHPDALHWLNITFRVQQRMARLWIEAIDQNEEVQRELTEKLRGMVVEVVLSRNSQVIDKTSAILRAGRRPVFAIEQGEELQFTFDHALPEQTNWRGMHLSAPNQISFSDYPVAPHNDCHCPIDTAHGRLGIKVVRRSPDSKKWFVTGGR